jgi:hypothetical protein
MDLALIRLMEVLPPPKAPVDRDVNWKVHEEALGLTFPTYFKELIGAYGACIWFDNYSILYPAPHDYKTADSFRTAVQGKLELLQDYGVSDEDGNPIDPPLYPEPGGLFPFMASSDGPNYFWKMESKNPDKWPMFLWEVELCAVNFKTLAELFLSDIEEYKKMDPERVEVVPSKRSE